MRLIPFACLAGSFLLGGCLSWTSVSKTYDFGRIQRVGILKFDSRFPEVLGVEDIFAKYLLANGLEVIERPHLEKLLKEQKFGATGAVTPETAKEIGEILGVDALLLGQVTSYIPERKEVLLVHTKNKYEEPVFEKQRQRQKDGSYIEVQKQIATKVRYEDAQVPQIYTSYAQVGFAVKLVDVESGQVCWVGSYTNEGLNAQLAIESTAIYLSKKLRKQLHAKASR